MRQVTLQAVHFSQKHIRPLRGGHRSCQLTLDAILKHCSWSPLEENLEHRLMDWGGHKEAMSPCWSCSLNCRPEGTQVSKGRQITQGCEVSGLCHKSIQVHKVRSMLLDSAFPLRTWDTASFPSPCAYTHSQPSSLPTKEEIIAFSPNTSPGGCNNLIIQYL